MISVIIPTYNCSRYLENCLLTLSKQKRLPDEVIIIDDGSDKGHAMMNIRHANKYGYDYHRGQHNGSNASRNIGFNLSSGDMVVFADSDCSYTPTYLQELEKALQENIYAPYAYCDFLVERDGQTKQHMSGYYKYGRLLRDNFIDTGALIRRDYFPYFDPNLKRLQDWDLWLNISTKTTEKPVYVQKTLYRNIIRPESISMTEDYTEAKQYIIKKYNL